MPFLATSAKFVVAITNTISRDGVIYGCAFATKGVYYQGYVKDDYYGNTRDIVYRDYFRSRDRVVNNSVLILVEGANEVNGSDVNTTGLLYPNVRYLCGDVREASRVFDCLRYSVVNENGRSNVWALFRNRGLVWL